MHAQTNDASDTNDAPDETAAPPPQPGSPLALDGVTVIELGSVVMVPFAAQLLADLGATVIRVESAKLDSGRVIGGSLAPGISGVALNLHRNKESIQLNLKTDTGKEVMNRLLCTADVFVTNMRRQALDRLDLGYGSVAKLNPRIVYCNANGFASGSADENRPAFDDIIQAETGLPALAGLITGRPRFFPTVIADKLSGMYVAQGVLAALVRRSVDGRGAHVEVPMFDAVLSFNLVEHLAGAAVAGGTSGYSRILSEHRGPHRTQDGYVAVMPYSDRDWEALYEFVGQADELEDPTFRDHRLRVENPDIVYASLGRVIAQRTTAEWVELCLSLGVPVAPVPDLDEIVNDPAHHRGVIEDADHPVVGRYRHVHGPIRIDGERVPLRRTAPLVGQDTRRILGQLGYSPSDIDGMIADGSATSADSAALDFDAKANVT